MDFYRAFLASIDLIVTLDPAFTRIVFLTLKVSLSALFISAFIGLPLGAWLGISRFPLRAAVLVLVNTLMGLPPVVVGLVLFLLLSRMGPLGDLAWLFTPKAMIFAQVLLIVPIIIALTSQRIEDLWQEYVDYFTSIDLIGWRALPSLLWEARFGLATILLAGFGRASAEVGAVLIVGGNIEGVTRVITTAIALETSKGDIPLALGLGIVLFLLGLSINILTFAITRVGARYAA